jgi:hypothetical protein
MKHARLIVAAICLAGLLLRLIGLQFGLPAVYNPDEVAIMARALAFAKGSLTRTTSCIRLSTSTSCSRGSAPTSRSCS